MSQPCVGALVPVFRYPHMFLCRVLRQADPVSDSYFVDKYGPGYWVDLAGSDLYQSYEDLLAARELAGRCTVEQVALPVSPFLAPGKTATAFLITRVDGRFA